MLEKINEYLWSLQELKNIDPNIIYSFLFLRRDISLVIDSLIVEKAKEMNAVWEEVNGKPKADIWKTNLDYSGREEANNLKLFFALEAWHDFPDKPINIPYDYFSDPNWKDKYKQICLNEKEKLDKSKFNDPDYQQYLKLKERFENEY